jgi:hypothetical protein
MELSHTLNRIADGEYTHGNHRFVQPSAIAAFGRIMDVCWNYYRFNLNSFINEHNLNGNHIYYGWYGYNE